MIWIFRDSAANTHIAVVADDLAEANKIANAYFGSRMDPKWYRPVDIIQKNPLPYRAVKILATESLP